MKRQVFFSFQYMKDAWRASQIRNMGVVEKNSTFSDNDWEEVKYKSDAAIKEWIDDQMRMRSCIVVLVGETTYNRKWVKYEIQRAYELGKGIVGIYVHNLKDDEGNQCNKGYNPFDFIITSDGRPLSVYVRCYDPPYSTSKRVYEYIEENINAWIEDAIDNTAP